MTNHKVVTHLGVAFHKPNSPFSTSYQTDTPRPVHCSPLSCNHLDICTGHGHHRGNIRRTGEDAPERRAALWAGIQTCSLKSRKKLSKPHNLYQYNGLDIPVQITILGSYDVALTLY